eukprot:COSAG01_NODE_53888_length_336_cov_0.561181_1_plen_55_part_10
MTIRGEHLNEARAARKAARDTAAREVSVLLDRGGGAEGASGTGTRETVHLCLWRA